MISKEESKADAKRTVMNRPAGQNSEMLPRSCIGYGTGRRSQSVSSCLAKYILLSTSGEVRKIL
jgi:hypothetical protein